MHRLALSIAAAALFFVPSAAAETTTLGKTGSTPTGITLDSKGNLYTANFGSNNVSKITPAGQSSLLATTGESPSRIVADSLDNLYVSNSGSNNVSRITPGGFSTIWGTTGPYPLGIAIDQSNNIYTTNYNSQSISRLFPGGGSEVFALTGANPWGIVSGADNTLFVSNYTSQTISRITNGQPRLFVSTQKTPTDMVLDDLGNLYLLAVAADRSNTSVLRIDPYGNITELRTVFGCFYDITIDSERSVYFPNYGCGSPYQGLIYKVTASGGLSIAGGNTDTGVPSGITIDSEGNVYTSNSGTNIVTKTVSERIAPAPPETPSPPLASPGLESATVSPVPNEINARYGQPTFYRVEAVEDPSRNCLVTPPETSCQIENLQGGRPWSFRTVAGLGSWKTAPSPPSAPVVPEERFRLEIQKSGSGSGTVISEPAGIECGPSCDHLFAEGTEVTLEATADPGSLFLGWDGAGCQGNGPCRISMNEALSVEAVFIERFTLEVSKNGTGQGSVVSDPAGISCGPDCSSSFPDGTMVTLLAWPDSNSVFTGWSGDCQGTDPCQVDIDRARNVVAAFTAIPNFPLQVEKVGSGGVSSLPEGIRCGNFCAKEFPENTSVELVADPAPGWVFERWSGGCSGSGGCTVTMNTAQTVTAHFVAPPPDPGSFQLRVAKSGSGSGEVLSSPEGIECGNSCTFVFTENEQIELQADPLPGSLFVGWSGACSGTSTCLINMNEEQNVTASFVSDPPLPGFFSLSVLQEGPGQGRVLSDPAGIDCGKTCDGDFVEGSKVVLAASASPGSSFQGWSGACQGTDLCQIDMNESHNVVAHFGESFLLQTTSSGQGMITSDPAGIDCEPDCASYFRDGTPVELLAEPLPGYAFRGWSGACQGEASCNVNMNAPRSVHALFTRQLELRTKKEGSGQGRILSDPAGIDCGTDCTKNYDQGESVVLRIEAASGSRFAGWSGDCSGTSSCLVRMDQETEVFARFERQIFVRVQKVSRKITTKSVRLRTRVRVPDPGTLRQKVKVAGKSYCSLSRRVSRSGTYTLQCRLGKRVRQKLRRKKLRAQIKVTFTAFQSQASARKNVTIPRRR